MPFRVVASDEAEDTDPGLPAAERVMAHARGKARDVAARVGVPPGGAVLGADTEVVLEGLALGKADDEGAARDMLRALAGRPHEVLTGMVLITESGEHEHLASAVVHMREMPDPILDWYLSRGEWQGRAGAYAVQGSGAALVTGIEGEPSTVIGLPVAALANLLQEAGIPAWE